MLEKVYDAEQMIRVVEEFFYNSFLVPDVKYFLILVEKGVLGGEKDFKKFEHYTKLRLWKKFEVQSEITFKQDFPLSWKSFFNAANIPSGIGFCEKWLTDSPFYRKYFLLIRFHAHYKNGSQPNILKRSRFADHSQSENF